MGAVTFSLDPGLANALKSDLPLTVFVETGTFKGDTAAAMGSIFDKVVTIELSEKLSAEAVSRFSECPRINVLQGDAAVKLLELRPELGASSVLYWLDAHWCVAENTAGELSQCPLLHELTAIGHLNEKSVILIDDARLFLAPPPFPHEVSQWPRLQQVVDCLLTLSQDHELMVVNDVIAFFPRQTRKVIESYVQSCGVDWLDASNCLKENGNFVGQLVAKEGVIQQQSIDLAQSFSVQKEKEEVIATLASQLIEREDEIQRLETDLQKTREQVALLEAMVNQKASEITAVELQLLTQEGKVIALSERLAERELSLQAYSGMKAIAKSFESVETNLALTRALEEKEAVIQELAKALEAYRSAFRLFQSLLRVFSLPSQLIAAVLAKFKSSARPKLGRLYQHAPIPMRIPGSYTPAGKLSSAPKISLITPSFKQGQYIGRTIDSVLSQNYPNLEYFVQDGGSDDGTVEVVAGYGNRITGMVSEPDGGQSQAINLGFARTTGDIMAWLNSDDLLLPGALHAVVEYFNTHPEVDVVYGDRLLIDENDMQIGRWIMPGHDSAVLSWVDYVPQETLFWRRRIWDKVGGKIDESFKFAMDWDLLVRFRDAGATFAHIPRFIGAFRIHEHQKTSASINQIGNQEMNRIRQRLLGKVPTQAEIAKAILPFMLKHIAADKRFAIKTRLGVGR